MSRHRLIAMLGAFGVAIGLMAVPIASGSTIAAAATVGPTGSAFYTPPSPLPAGNHGSLIWYRSTTVNLGAGAPSVNAWDIMYDTEDALGAQDIATGTILVPTALWLGGGTRPVIDYAPGSQGLAADCAPSIQLANGTEYEASNLVAALNQGWAVVLTDYQGYTTSSGGGEADTEYTIGAAEGHAVLDAVTAADSVPSTGLSATTKTVIWGYSQGGQAAAWAGQLEPTYDPSMNLIGVAAGGVPANLEDTANYLNGSTGAGFLAMSILGLALQYPNAIDLSTIANTTGLQAIAQLAQQCVFQTLETFENVNLDTYTQGAQTLDSLLAQPAIAAVVQDQQLGLTKIDVPVFQYHGQADEIVPLAQDEALKQAYCSEGVTDEFELYPGEHVTTQFQAAPQVVSWISGRLAGTAAPNNCLELKPAPTSDANPGGGDFNVSLNNWPLTASLHLKTLDGTIPLPSNSTFSGNTDLTSQQLQDGKISIPSSTPTLKALGVLPLVIGLTLVQQGPATGTASLSSTGQLAINGSVSEEIELTSIKFAGINIVNSTCKTTSAMVFPLDFSGPISDLGGGLLNFSGTTTFPPVSGCGVLGSILSVLIPGPGNTYSFTVAPPAPSSW